MELSRPKVWILAARPKTLWAAVSPVVIGSVMALADKGFHPLSAVAALFGAVAIQIGTNFANDHYDFIKGTDRADRVGPTRVTQAGMVSPAAMKRAAALAFMLASLAGVYLVYRGGWPILAIGVLSITFGVLYTAGPLPIGYLGLGELFVLVFFGPVAVGGSYYVQAVEISWPVILAGIPPGLFSVAILSVNNLRDIDSDTLSGKRTLAVRFGRRFARVEYLLAITIACLIPATLLTEHAETMWNLLPLLVLPVALPAIRTIFSKTDGRALNDALAITGRLLLIYTILFSIGWLL